MFSQLLRVRSAAMARSAALALALGVLAAAQPMQPLEDRLRAAMVTRLLATVEGLGFRV